MDVKHKHVYKFDMKYCLRGDNYKHGDDAKCEAMSNRFNADKICIYITSASQIQ
jgi:hypothetical protein